MKLVVTGATGYIGTRLIFLASRRGHAVVIASRRRSLSIPWLHYDLASNEGLVLPVDTNFVLHLAANVVSPNSLDDEVEVAAAQGLIKSVQKAGARFIFVSSQTALEDAPTAYGRTKWRIEQEVLAAGGWVVRPGQVYGGELRGLYGALAKAVQTLPLLPAFIPTPKVQPIHVDDLAEGLLRIAERDDLKSGVYRLASSVPIPFSSFLAEIAKNRLRCRRFFVPVPVAIINLFISLLGEAWQTRFGLDRLRSLFKLPPMITASDLSKLGLRLRPLSAGLHPSGDDRRRRLLREGKALLTFVLREQPGSSLMCRYVRAVECSRGGIAFGLPDFFMSYPFLLSLIDQRDWPDAAVESEFAWRVDAATMLAEATRTGAGRFLGVGQRHGLLVSMHSIINALAGEAFWRLLRVLVSPILYSQKQRLGNDL